MNATWMTPWSPWDWALPGDGCAPTGYIPSRSRDVVWVREWRVIGEARYRRRLGDLPGLERV